MKDIAWAIIFILSGELYAGEEIRWESRSDDELPNKYHPSLNVAKEWAKKYYEKERDIIKFEYSVSEQAEGYEVMVMPVYKGGFVTIDGETCVYTDKEQKFVNSKQCMAP